MILALSIYAVLAIAMPALLVGLLFLGQRSAGPVPAPAGQVIYFPCDDLRCMPRKMHLLRLVRKSCSIED